MPRYGYRDSPRISKKFEFTYPGTTSLFAPGSPGSHSGPPSSHATTSGQQFYNRLASGTLGASGGEEGKSAGGRHPVSPKGQSAKGLKTRDNKRTDKFIIRRRKRKKR